ncbi:MAG: hypothetical protein IPP71_10295 [Bacteroidetes bacterium]|nr:hypothetical protein [Bacteroidota bacterium]
MEKPFVLSAEAVLKPKNGGKSFLEEGVEITAHTLKTFWADQHALKDIVSQFKNIGFSVSTITKTGFFFSGTTSLFEEKLAAEGEKIDIVFDGVQNINKLTNNPILTISPTLFNGNILSILISSPSIPDEFNPRTQSGWPENEEQWNQQKQIAIENHQTQLWELPRLLGAEPKTNEKHLEGLDANRWPYDYDGEGVEVHVIDSGVIKDHPYFVRSFEDGYNKNWEFVNLDINKAIKSFDLKAKQFFTNLLLLKNETDVDNLKTTWIYELLEIYFREKIDEFLEVVNKSNFHTIVDRFLEFFAAKFDQEAKFPDSTELIEELEKLSLEKKLLKELKIL